jgi:pimeloyl-ACP methyl ester carboxylesterase
MEALKRVSANTSPWNGKSVVFVHGIGDHPDTFAQPVFDILRKNDPSLAAATRWYGVGYDYINDQMTAKLGLAQKALTAPQTVTVELLLDLLDYLGAKDLNEWVNTAYKKALADIVADGQDQGVEPGEHEIYIVSHSLGTVVSYETLHAIVNNPQTLGVAKNFRVQALYTFGSPIAFIKKNENKIPSFANTALKAKPVGKPTRQNALTGKTQTNVSTWFNFRQKFDPVASLVPLTLESSNGALDDDFVFEKFHAGPNPHEFANYITEYADFLVEDIRG